MSGHRVITMADATLGEVSNDGTTPAILCLANAESGKILVLNLERGDGKALYCFKHAFLCAMEGINMEPKMLPMEMSYMTFVLPHLFNKAHYIEATQPTGSKLYIQAGGEIFTKELKRSETLMVRFGCMVAFEQSVKITAVSPFHAGFLCLPGLGNKEPFLQLTGPGNVYFCAQTTPRKAAFIVRARTSINSAVHANTSLVGFILYITMVAFSFYTLSLVLNRVAVEFEQQIDGNNLLQRL